MTGYMKNTFSLGGLWRNNSEQARARARAKSQCGRIQTVWAVETATV